MTFIISGKLKDRTFLLSDCIATGEYFSFTEKITELSSKSNMFFAFAGVRLIGDSINLYDTWLQANQKTNDFLTGNSSINGSIELLKDMIRRHPEQENLDIPKTNRLFFLDNTCLVYYDLIFDNNTFSKYEKFEVNEGNYIDSMIDFHQEKFEQEDDKSLKQNCIDYITKQKNTHRKEIDFVDRFSFIQLFNTGQIKRDFPYKKISDLVSLYYSENVLNIDK